FHHGREVTADDVVYSLTRILDPKVKSGSADLFASIRGAQEFREGKAKHVSGLTALDSHTVQVVLNEAWTPFVSILAVGHAKIVPKELVEQQGEAFGAHPIGTGPFKFVRWEPGREIVLVANPDYFDGPPKLTRVVYRIFRGEEFDAMYEQFQRGHLEDTPIQTQEYQRVAAADKYIRVKRPMFSVRFYGFNTQIKPQDNLTMRQGKFPMFLYAWFADVPHPDNFLFKLFHSRSPRNFTAHSNPVVDELLLEAKRERDLPHQTDLYRQAEQLVLDDAPIMPVWHYTYERLFQPYVRSVEVNGLGDPYIPLRKMWLDARPRP